MNEKELLPHWNIVATFYLQLMLFYATVTSFVETQNWTSEVTDLMWETWMIIQLIHLIPPKYDLYVLGLLWGFIKITHPKCLTQCLAHTKVFNKYFFIIYRHSFWGWFCLYQTLWTCQKIKLPELPFCYLSSMGIRFNAPSKSTDFLHAYLTVELAHHNSSEKLVLEYL